MYRIPHWLPRLARALASINTLTLDTHHLDFSITYVGMLRVGEDTAPLTSRWRLFASTRLNI